MPPAGLYRARTVPLLVGAVIGSAVAFVTAPAGCGDSKSNGANGPTEEEAKAFLDEFAPEFALMTIEMLNRALVGHTESAVVSKEHETSDFSVPCPGGGTVDFSIETLTGPTVGVPTGFVGEVTSTNCMIGPYTVTVVGTLPTTAEEIEGGHGVDASGTLSVMAGARTFDLVVSGLRITVTDAGVCYSAAVNIPGGPPRIEGGDDTSCHEPTTPTPDGGMPDAGPPEPVPDCPDNKVEFSDTEFALSDWTAEGARDPVDACGDPRDPATACFNERQEANGGNPGAYRGFDLYNGGSGTISVKHMRNDAVYDPATSGAIDGIEMALDALGGMPGSSLETAFSMLAEQDGKLYWTERLFVNNSQGWTSSFLPEPDRRHLTEADFRLFPQTEFDETPDFSAEGAPLSFGFLTAVSGERTDNGVDNWIVRICQ